MKCLCIKDYYSDLGSDDPTYPLFQRGDIYNFKINSNEMAKLLNIDITNYKIYVQDNNYINALSITESSFKEYFEDITISEERKNKINIINNEN